MALSGIAAVQARIQAIQEQIGGIAAPVSSDGGTQGKTGADFASLLTGAMSTQAAVGAGNLTGAGAGAGAAPGNSLSSMVQSLTGGGTSTAPDISSLISSLNSAGGSGPTTTAGPNATTRQFLDLALAQSGKPYVWASNASSSDANPATFDCSELTKWAAARSGVTIPDGAAHQYVWLKEQGATMSVQQALQTPGALLFTFADEPQPGLGGEPARAHVAISLGNGKTIEARGRAYGVGVFDAADRFNYAGMIPGMT